jgi:OOP family OmpA-OmpF porin
MKFCNAFLASAMVCLPLAAANAQAINGLYIGGGLGVNLKQPENGTLTVVGLSTSGHFNADAGPVAVLSVGWGFGNGFRAEVEGSYRHNQLQRSGGVTDQLAGGMINGFYDFVGLVPAVQPYVGLGIGYQEEILNGFNTSSDGISLRLPRGSAGSFAYQAIVGAALPLSGARGLSLTAEYRFMGLVGDRAFNGTATGFGVTVPFKFTSTDNFNHSILAGFRYAF